MPNVLDTEKYPELTTLLHVIATGAPGWGKSLREIRTLPGLTQDQLAAALNLSRTAVSHWDREKHRPSPAVLRKALITMRVDARLIEKHFPGTIGAVVGPELHTDPGTLALTLANRILEVSGADPDAIEDMIHDTLDMKVLAAQGLKALSDPRSAALFLERGDRRRERRRRQERNPDPAPENTAFVRRPSRVVNGERVFDDDF